MARFNIGDHTWYKQNGDYAGTVTNIYNDMVTVEYWHVIRHNDIVIDRIHHTTTIHEGFLVADK